MVSSYAVTEAGAILSCERLMTEDQNYGTFFVAPNSALTQKSVEQTGSNKESTKEYSIHMAMPTYYG